MINNKKMICFISAASVALSTTTWATESQNNKNNKPAKPLYKTSRLQIGPYLSTDDDFDGSALMVNVTKVREAAKLLMHNAHVNKSARKQKLPEPQYPRLTISGMLEGSANYSTNYVNQVAKHVNLSGAEVVTYLQAASWLSAFAAFDYDTSPTVPFRIDVYRAFVTLGNLEKTPVYGAIGQMYLPFGSYASLMASAPLTRSLGRTDAPALVLGYQQLGDNALHAAAYIYQDNDSQANGGGDLAYQFKGHQLSGTIGVGVIGNLADSQGIQETVFNNHPQSSRHIPGLDIYAQLTYQHWVWLSEYVTAMRSFQACVLAFKDHGAEPNAFHTELGYTFKSFNKPSSLAVSYDRSGEALALNLAKHSYAIAYNINVWKRTNLALEYRFNQNYPVSDVSPGQSTQGLGQDSNQINLVFDYFF